MEISENLKLPNANSLSSSPHHSQAFVATGFNIIMNFDTSTHFNPAHRQCDFDREVGKVSLIFLQIPLFRPHCFQFQWGSGQTTRASSPSSEHQILKKNIGGEFQSSSPLLLFPKSGCYTHPSPPRCWCSYCPLPTKLFLTKLATASLPLSLKKTAVVLSPSSSPSPQPSQADSNYC